MKKVFKSTNVQIDKTELKKFIIYKLEDDDDVSIPAMYFTLKALRTYTLETIWHKWEEMISENEKQDFSIMEIYENDEYLFAYLDSWNYKVSRITYQDVK
jgi:hypothetical protein